MKGLILMALAWLPLWCAGQSHKLIEKLAGPFAANTAPNGFAEIGRDSLPLEYVKVKVEQLEVDVKLTTDEQKRWKAPCTYVLDDGRVVYSYCEGLHHTPHRGQESWKIQEVRPGLLYFERYRDTTSYLPAPYMPRASIEKAPIPYRLEYYGTGYEALLRTVDIYKDNPYTKEKMPEIEIEQCYDAELGFDHSKSSNDAAYLWTYSWVVFFDNGYTGLAYSLGRYSSRRGLMGFTRTLTVLDKKGQEVFRLDDLDGDISPSMVTNDGKFLGVVLNKESDINHISDRMGLPGIRIYDMVTGKMVFEDVASSNAGYYEGLTQQMASPLVFYSKREHIYNDAKTTLVFLDLEGGTKYEGIFTKEQIMSGIISWSDAWEKIIQSSHFHSTKF